MGRPPEEAGMKLPSIRALFLDAVRRADAQKRVIDDLESQLGAARLAIEVVRGNRHHWGVNPDVHARVVAQVEAQGRVIDEAKKRLGRFPEMTNAEAAEAAGAVAALLFSEQGEAT